jgi:putative membrane protein
VGFFRTIRAANQTPEAIQLHESAIRFGVTLVVLGIAATSMSAVAHWFALGRLRRDEAPALGRWPLSITLALLVSILGLVSLAALFW